jgi:hypothetical protein
MRDDLLVGWPNAVHDLTAVGRHELAVDVMRGDRLDGVSVRDCCHIRSPSHDVVMSECGDDDPVESGFVHGRVALIYVTEGNRSRDEVVQVQPALQVEVRVHRYVALEVG